MNRATHLTFAAAMTAALAAHAAAGNLYSTDVNTKRLVRINDATAQITDIGLLQGFNGTVADLEFAGSRLFALVNVSPNRRLFELDPATAAILSDVLITVDGAPLTAVAESLASDSKGNLYIAYDSSGMFGGSNSATVGQLALDGTVSGSVLVGRDCDGLTINPTGEFFGVDRDPATMTNTLFVLGLSPVSSGTLVTVPFSTDINGLDDLALNPRGLFALDFITRRLVRFEPSNGNVISATPYDASFTLAQIAAPPPCQGDADGDGDRDFADITAVLSSFGLFPGAFGPGDADGDGDVDFADITSVLQGFELPCL